MRDPTIYGEPSAAKGMADAAAGERKKERGKESERREMWRVWENGVR